MGEPESGRDDMLMEIEQQCLEIYRRKVDQAYQCRAQLRQAIADAEAELAQIFSVLGERPTNIKQVRVSQNEMLYPLLHLLCKLSRFILFVFSSLIRKHLT